jgi:hypothetical protein
MLEATDLEFCVFSSLICVLSAICFFLIPVSAQTELVETVDEPPPPSSSDKSLCYLRLDDRSRSGKGRAAYLETALAKLRTLATTALESRASAEAVGKAWTVMRANLDAYNDCTVFIFDGSYKLEMLACMRKKLGVASAALASLPSRTDDEYIIVEKGLGGSDASVRLLPKLE